MNTYSPNKRDTYIFPDLHNTGCHGTLEEGSHNRPGASWPQVTENKKFTNYKIYFNSYQTFNYDTYYFNNCEFDGQNSTIYAIQVDNACNVKIVFNNCTFHNYTSAINGYGGNGGIESYEFNNCYAYDMQGDAWKLDNGNKIVNCYSSGCGLDGGTHGDCFQFREGYGCHAKNSRLENLPYTGRYANCCAYVDFENGSITETTDIDLDTLYLNGGGYSMYLISASGYTLSNINVRGCEYGCTYHYGSINGADPGTGNLIASSQVYIGSVWKENNQIHFLATNYTNTNKTIIVKTNNGTYTKSITKCPTYSELHADETQNLPFDVEFTIPDAKYIVCFDDIENEAHQIRFVDFGVPHTYSHTYHDFNIMPDSHNTGLLNESLLRHHTECTTEFPITIPERGAIRLSAAQIQNFGGRYENIFFDGAYFYPKGGTTEPYDIYFTNCYFKGEYYNDDGVLQHSLAMCQGNSGFNYNYHFTNCVFDGYTNGCVTYGRNTTFANCISRNMWQDLFKLSSGATYTNCWGYLAGKETGAHADGIQWSGGNPTFSIDGLRLDNYTLDPCLYANCCFYIDHEGGAVYDLNVPDGSAKNMWCNGGGYTYWIRSSGDAYSVSHFTPENAWYGAHHTYGAKGQGATDGHSWDDTKEITTALVSSVWKENDGIHLIAHNYTSTDRNIIIKTNVGTYTKSVPHIPLYEEEHSYTWETLPLDVEFTIPDASFIVCFDTSESETNQIRFVEFESTYIDSIESNGIVYDIEDKDALRETAKVTSIDSTSTNNQIPTAKAVYEALPPASLFEDISNKVTFVDEDSTDEQYASAKCTYVLIELLEERLENI